MEGRYSFMTRLPVVSSDNNTWGTTLNAFLAVAHNADGSLILTKSGLAKISCGAQQWGIPTHERFLNVGTSALNVNEVRYIPMRVDYAVTLTAWQLEVTTGPAGSANLRLGVYAADTNLQPTGAPLYDSGSVAVAMS